MNDQAELICARCGQLLTPGSGDFWEVRIEAVADPHPPHFTEEDLQRDTHRDWNALIESLRDVSPREAMDQVYRHTVLHLCQTCFTRWYEQPVD